jgi:hypothetical protein
MKGLLDDNTLTDLDGDFLRELGSLRTYWQQFCDSLPLSEDLKDKKEFRNGVLLLLISIMVFDMLRREKRSDSGSLMRLFEETSDTLRKLVLMCFGEEFRVDV